MLSCLHLERHRFTVCMAQRHKNCTANFTVSTRRSEHWRLRLFAFGCNVVHRAGIKNHATGALQQLKASETSITILDTDIRNMMVSLVDQVVKNINDDHDRSVDLLCICKQF